MRYLVDNEYRSKNSASLELLRAIRKRPRQAQMFYRLTSSVRFNPRPVCVGYVVDKMALGQVVLLVFQHSPVRTMPPPLHTLSLVYHRHCKIRTPNSIKTHKSRFSHFIKMQDFREVRTCRVANTYRRFEWSQCLRLRGKAVQRMTTQSTLKMEANVGNCLPMYGVCHLKILESSSTRLCELQISQVSL